MNSRYGEDDSGANQQIDQNRHQSPNDCPGHAMQADSSGTVSFSFNTQKFSFMILDLCADFLNFMSVHHEPPWITGWHDFKSKQGHGPSAPFSIISLIVPGGSEKVPGSLTRSVIFQ